MRIVTAFVLLCVLWLPPNAGWAQDAEAERGRALFEQGRSAFERELYTEAEDAFLAAYEAMSADDRRRPLILFNVAQAIERQGGRDDDALAAWRRFRTEAASVAPPEYLRRAEARIRELSERAERRGEPASEEESTPPVEAPPEPTGFDPHWSGIVVLSVGVAALIAGAGVGIFGLTERAAVLDACEGTSCPAHVQQRAADLPTWGIVADSLLWPGLTLAAAGALMMFLIPNEVQADAPVTASCGPAGCVLGGRW